MIFTKRINERLDYVFDFTNFLGDDAITNASVSVMPSGLYLDTMLFNDTAVRQFVTGGTDGTDYTLTGTITTAEGRIKELDIIVRVSGT